MYREDTNMAFRVRQVWTRGDTDSPEFENVIVYFAGDFIVVAKSENDSSPTWINHNDVLLMRGVREL